jgi:tyrosyl-tRNA synthetase
LIKQNAVELNGAIVTDVRASLDLSPGSSVKLRVGKRRFLEIVTA